MSCNVSHNLLLNHKCSNLKLLLSLSSRTRSSMYINFFDKKCTHTHTHLLIGSNLPLSEKNVHNWPTTIAEWNIALTQMNLDNKVGTVHDSCLSMENYNTKYKTFCLFCHLFGVASPLLIRQTTPNENLKVWAMRTVKNLKSIITILFRDAACGIEWDSGLLYQFRFSFERSK